MQGRACSSPPKLLKENGDVCKEPLKAIINNGIRTHTSPSNLKTCDIIPVHKKDDVTDKTNYRPICLHPSISK